MKLTQEPDAHRKAVMTKARTLATAAAAAIVALVLAACTTTVDGQATAAPNSGGGDSASSAGPSDPAGSTESSESTESGPSDPGITPANPTDEPSAPQGPGGGTSALPDDFPVPDGVDLSGAGGAAFGQAPDGKAAYDFWVAELPPAGYTVTSSDTVGEGAGFTGLIEFNGNGVTKGTIAILGTTVAISFE